MDEVMRLIKETLPNLSQETFENVKEKLIDIGVSDVDDMQLVQEQDLSVLKPIQIRKIIQLCSARLLLICNTLFLITN